MQLDYTKFCFVSCQWSSQTLSAIFLQVQRLFSIKKTTIVGISECQQCLNLSITHQTELDENICEGKEEEAITY